MFSLAVGELSSRLVAREPEEEIEGVRVDATLIVSGTRLLSEGKRV